MKASSSHSREQGQAAKEFFTSIKTITIQTISKNIEAKQQELEQIQLIIIEKN